MTINGSSETRPTAKCSFQHPLRCTEGIRVVARAGKFWERTFSVDPQKRALRVPLIEDASLEEPRGGSILMGFVSNVVVFRRIRRAKPIFGGYLHLVACNPP
jgi:hypothetical protein